MADPIHAEYRVQLEAYAGPLDLLLYLVKRHEIDLYDIPIAKLTEQYLEHLKVIEAIAPQLDMDQAGEFLVMAATLLEIKSQMLVPRIAESTDAEAQEQATDPIEDRPDPRWELVQQLLAYKQYKDAALELEHRGADWAKRFTAHPKKAGADASAAEPREIELEDANVLDLCSAFSRILDSIGQKRDHAVTYDDTPLALHAEDIYDLLQRSDRGSLSLAQIFEGRRSRSELIGLFLAMLELVREKRVRVAVDDEQAPGQADRIRLEPVPPEELERAAAELAAESSADWTDPQTGEVQYDWPDPEGRRRHERRERLRQLRAERLAAGESVEDLDEEEEQDAEHAEHEPDGEADQEADGQAG
jgi:segregation and condensation protein A